MTLLIAALGVFGVLAYTANTGGQIRHTELRDGSPQTALPDVSDHEEDDH